MSETSDRIRSIVEAGLEEDLPAGDQAVLESILSGLDEPDAAKLLEEFFDVEVVTHGVYEAFKARGHHWLRETRSQLAEALLFCGFDAEADDVLAGLIK